MKNADKNEDPFFSFWHICPVCGAYVDDGSSDGRCFDCLEAEAQRREQNNKDSCETG